MRPLNSLPMKEAACLLHGDPSPGMAWWSSVPRATSSRPVSADGGVAVAALIFADSHGGGSHL